MPLDNRIGNKTVLMVNNKAPGQRLILAPTGALDRDYDDARRYFDAAKTAILEAKQSGSINPAMLVIGGDDKKYQDRHTVAYLGACQALWQPLEAREYHGDAIEPIQSITMVGEFDC